MHKHARIALANARAFATELGTVWGRRRQPVDEEKRVVKDAERSRERTMNRAVKLLAAKPRSIGELRQRLLEKLWTNDEIVDAVIEKLKDYKYLDDEQFARDLAVSKLRQKPQGKRRLQQSMSQKKLDKELLATAITEAFEKLPEADLIDTAIAKRLRLKGSPQTREDTKKFYDHLLRQGFGFDLIREKMSAVDHGRFGDDD
jgi:regulatory protein